MEGLMTALQNFNWSSLAKPAEVGLTGAGLVGNLITGLQRNQELNYLKSQQAALADPTKLAAEVAGATAPLNKNLTEAVGNVVQGSLAEQGLSQAPGIFATAESQALAPFQQQNQQTALQLVLERLGLPLQYASTYLGGLPQPANLAPLLYLLQSKNPTATLNLPGNSSGFYSGATAPVLNPATFANYGPFQSPTDISSDLGDFNFPDLSAGVSV